MDNERHALDNSKKRDCGVGPLQRFVSWIYVILNPQYWLQNKKYSSSWDRKLNELMLVEKFTNIDRCHATIGKYRVWVANHPYASFTINSTSNVPWEPDQVRPSRRTIYFAMQKLKRDYYS